MEEYKEMDLKIAENSTTMSNMNEFTEVPIEDRDASEDENSSEDETAAKMKLHLKMKNLSRRGSSSLMNLQHFLSPNGIL